ncbi:MAG: sigma-70 family RNA polymerase sigma factor [Myxococcaceae bacterium]|jgi:RNA polymerase sigma-70 factor (ECF subfamily)|nr:sigma-70 family RNA polymerase sigma factor [Myxococcaceae bacterium]
MADERTQRFNELYRRFAPAVFRRAAALLGGDEAAAQDITQEVFLAFFRNEGRLRGEASPFTVLYQMATYQAVDRLRHRARWHGTLKALPDDEAALDEVAQLPATESATARVDAMHDLALLTKGEDEQTLTCAVLYFVEGYTTEEVAQALDLSRKTVGRALAAFAERANKRAERFTVKGPP